jgi:hypothetical protein
MESAGLWFRNVHFHLEKFPAAGMMSFYQTSESHDSSLALILP